MTEGQDLSALLQQGTREYTRLYERHAYRAYNLALRITCARESALKASEDAFLTQTSAAQVEGDLLWDTAKFAIREADAGAETGGAGGADAEALLRATARLPATERAALALSHLAGAGSEQIAAVLELTPDAADGVLVHAYESLSAALSVSPDDARAAYEGWLVAEPPAELWERVYPRFYMQLEKDLRGSASVSPGAAVAGKVSRRRVRLRGRLPRRLPRLRTALVVAALALAGLGALQYTGGGVGDDTDFSALAEGEIPGVDEADTEDVARSDGDPYDPLTPKELDKLRLEELRDLRAQGEHEQARELATRRKRALAEAARTRRERKLEQKRTVLERKRAERERKLAERQHEEARRREEASRGNPPPPSGGGGGGQDGDGELHVTIEEHRSDGGGSNGGGGNGPSRDEADDNCLYDEDSGTYMCPD
jgi:hypothetical protein